MKNKKIINSLDKILPDNEHKQIMLNNIIMGNNNKKAINYKSLIPALCFLCMFTFVLFNYNNTEPKQMRAVEGQILYNGICYEEAGIYEGDISDLKFIEESKEFMMGDKIYKNGDSIVFENDQFYIEYTKCERK